jgi:hypothetical protein
MWRAIPVGRVMSWPDVTVSTTRDAVLLLPHANVLNGEPSGLEPFDAASERWAERYREIADR